MKIKTIEVSFLQTNCMIIWDEATHHGIIIDPGAKSAKVLDTIETENLVITHILITHGHFDHVGGVNFLVEALKEQGQAPQVCMHGLEKEEMEAGAKKQHEKQFFDIDIDLKDKQSLNVGFTAFDLIVVPGHTSYSVCFYNKEHGFVVSGDTLFYRTIGTSGYYNGPDTDLREYVKRRLLTLADETVVYPGHGDTTTIGDEKRMNPFLA
ncbi:MBL fold metallo-hydrolase [Vallitaleaceae bacterium 9-2]